MKKAIQLLLIGIILLPISLKAQVAEKAYSFAKVKKPHEYYLKQAELWWKEIEKDITNEDAWYNYYRTNRNCKGTYNGAFTIDSQKNSDWTNESPYLKKLDEIVTLIEKNVPNTFTYYRLKKSENHNTARLIPLLKAHEIDPKNPEIYEDIITCYELSGNFKKRKEFNEKLFVSNWESSGFMSYNYNVLMSMKPNSIILTYGDNDTYPLWILQDALGIRTDIVVLNIHLLADSDYQRLMFKKININPLEKEYLNGSCLESRKEITSHIINNKAETTPLYIGTPAWKDSKEYEKNLYLTGLVMEYSESNIDNIALLKNNFENNYALDYIRVQFSHDISKEMVERINVNYLPGIAKLFQHYQLSGSTEKAQKIKDIGLLIAERVGGTWEEKAKEILK